MINAEQLIKIQEFDKSGNVIMSLDANSSDNTSLYVFHNFASPLIDPFPIIYEAKKYKTKSQLAIELASNQKEQEKLNNRSCVKDTGFNNSRNEVLCEFFEIKNTEYYDYFMLYSTTNGVLQNLIDSAMEKIISEI